MQPTKLYQPIKFKRWAESQWEQGKKCISLDSGDEWFEDAKGHRVEQIFTWEIDWGI